MNYPQPPDSVSLQSERYWSHELNAQRTRHIASGCSLADTHAKTSHDHIGKAEVASGQHNYPPQLHRWAQTVKPGPVKKGVRIGSAKFGSAELAPWRTSL